MLVPKLKNQNVLMRDNLLLYQDKFLDRHDDRVDADVIQNHTLCNHLLYRVKFPEHLQKILLHPDLVVDLDHQAELVLNLNHQPDHQAKLVLNQLVLNQLLLLFPTKERVEPVQQHLIHKWHS